MVFDDLIGPRPSISETARKYVYDCLLFDTDFSFQGYQEALRNAGFEVMEAFDLSENLRKSYYCLGRMAQGQQEHDPDTFSTLSFAFDRMVEAIQQGELGWGMYVCRK